MKKIIIFIVLMLSYPSAWADNQGVRSADAPEVPLGKINPAPLSKPLSAPIHKIRADTNKKQPNKEKNISIEEKERASCEAKCSDVTEFRNIECGVNKSGSIIQIRKSYYCCNASIIKPQYSWKNINDNCDNPSVSSQLSEATISAAAKDANPPPARGCTIGMEWNGKKCVCMNGQHWDGNECADIPVCSFGCVWVDGECKCATGTGWNGNHCTDTAIPNKPLPDKTSD